MTMTTEKIAAAEQQVRDLIQSAARGEGVTHERIQEARDALQRAHTDAEIQQAIEAEKTHQQHEAEIEQLRAASDAWAEGYAKMGEKEKRARDVVNAAVAKAAKALDEWRNTMEEMRAARHEAHVHNGRVRDPHSPNPVLKALHGSGLPIARHPDLQRNTWQFDWELVLKRGQNLHTQFRQTLPES